MGPNMAAQGIALGIGLAMSRALQGHHILPFKGTTFWFAMVTQMGVFALVPILERFIHHISPFQGYSCRCISSQGVALGCFVLPFQGNL